MAQGKNRFEPFLPGECEFNRQIISDLGPNLYIHLGRVLVWCGVNQLIIYFSEVSILPCVSASMHLFLQIVLVLNL